MMRRTAVALTVGLALTPAPADDYREGALVRRIQWPVTIEPRVPGGCDDLTAVDVKVTEDGVEVPVDAVEKRRLRAVHAILIDTSGSMSPRLADAKRAARAYLERLPADEPALLATFSDSLILNTALTTDRDALLGALDRVELGTYTALHDAVHYTVKHLATRPERKILVLLSDGCDSASLAQHSLDSVARLTAEVPGLTVFPIGIDLPATCTRSMLTAARTDSPVLALERLARNSGGRIYRTQVSAELGAIFDQILARVQTEGFVAYRPLYYGTGAKDHAGKPSLRRVRVASLRPKRCKIESAGPAGRIEQAPDAGPPIAPEDGGIGRLDLRDGAMVGHGADLERESSFLYSAAAYLKGHYRTDMDQEAYFVTRDYTVEVPPFDRLKQAGADLPKLLLSLLLTDDRPFVPVPGAPSPREHAYSRLGEKWLHGQTFLEIREALGRGLFAYDGYREFAYRKAQEAYVEEMRDVLESSSEVRALSADDRAKLERAIAEQRPEPTGEQLQRFLAEWLGDVRAHDLVLQLEAWAINALLDAPVPRPEAASLVAAIDTHWKRLAQWFPPPTQVRIVSPLLPRYDSERDVVGFWRIVLPEVAQDGPPSDRIPERPLALTLLRGWVRRGLTVSDLRYTWNDTKERRRVLGDARRTHGIEREALRRGIPMVAFQVALKGQDPLALTVLWNPGTPPTPLCIDLGDPESRPSGAWVDEFRGIAPACG